MAHSTSISHIGDKLVVGAVDTSFLSGTSRIAPGTAVLNGPVVIGATGGLGVDRATCMIGPPLLGLAVPASLEVTGITNIIGVLNVSAISFFTGLLTASGGVIINAVETKNGVDLKNALSLGNDTTICNAPMIVNSIVRATDFVSDTAALNATAALADATAALAASNAANKKGFDIFHPTKKNHRLRHICLEGPSAEVYFRGTLKDNNIIQIPEYWSNLVDIESIGINLTPITCHQELFVDKIESNRIIIKNNAGGPIHCSYVVYGERIDGEKNIPEYQGLTPNDYPGDNNEYTINGL
jgi:hypothetical protein